MSQNTVVVGSSAIGEGLPVYVIAEIGVNHNGSLEIAKKLITAARTAGADVVKFQKRTPELCVPRDQWSIQRDTPWGRMTYIDYRRRVEFCLTEFADIDSYCRSVGIEWTASCWDEPSVDFIQAFNPPFYKLASASLTDFSLLRKLWDTGRPVMISTGMSTLEEIDNAVQFFLANGADVAKRLLIAHSTSTYPCPLEQLNLRMLSTLRERYPGIPVGYSGHETGLAPTLAAVAMGARFVERHITLDRAMWGSDQAASVEPGGLQRLVTNIRDIEASLGDGVKRVYASEEAQRRKLRRTHRLELVVDEPWQRLS